MGMSEPRIAVVIPAYNEELTIKAVMQDFLACSPKSHIVVVDNASTDKTFQIASAYADEIGKERCTVLQESRRGKASAVKRAFADIDADVYVMVDADCTYPAEDLPNLLQPVLEGRADMVVGNRHAGGAYSRENKRRFHDLGNKLVLRLINLLFHGNLHDILSGYRVMTRPFVKGYPILSKGFAIETELSIHALDKGFRVVEVPTHYKDRPEGSFSKLNTIGDGIRVLTLIFDIFINFRPLLFFCSMAAVLMFLGIVSGSVPLVEFYYSRFITHVPLALLAVGLVLSSILAFFTGVILHNARYNRNFLYVLMTQHD